MDRPAAIEHLRRRYLPLRAAVDEHAQVVFTHGDLESRNILVHDGHLAAIVDWETAAFMPVWREYALVKRCERCKAWRARVDEILDPYQAEYEALIPMAMCRPLSFL